MKQRGDTLVEVLLATVVISMVIAGAFTLTNRATRGNQAAIERTTVANLMREQIELIRGIRSGGTASGSWQAILSNSQTEEPNYDIWDKPTIGQGLYIKLVQGDPAKDDLSDSGIVVGYNDNVPDGCPAGSVDAYLADIFCMWVEAVWDGASDFINFHVRTYWDGIGDQGPQRESLILKLKI